MPARGRCVVIAAVALCARAAAAEAHRPPPGFALEHRAEVAGHVVEVMVVPKEPRAGERGEVIVTIRERDTGQAYRGYVTFLVAPPAGEPGPPVIPLEFGPGQFESAHVFRGPGVHALSIVFDAEGAERRVGPIPVSVRAVGRTAASIALALALAMSLACALVFRRIRRRAPPTSP